MKNRIKITLIVLMALALGACGTTTADTVGLHYNDGPLEGESFGDVIEPGSGQQFFGPFDRLIRLPINQRDYTFCDEVRTNDTPGCDAPAIKVTALGGAELAFSGGITFELNTDDRAEKGEKSIVQQFYEELCRKFDCADEEGVNEKGWDEMLRVNMRGPIEDSLQEEIRGYSVDALYAGVPGEDDDIDDSEALSVLTQVSDAIEVSLRETINAYAGGPFFCGPAYERSSPGECPDFEFIITEVEPTNEDIVSAFNKNVSSRQAVVDARNRATAEKVEAEGTREAQEVLNETYANGFFFEAQRVQAMLECAMNTNCTLIFGNEDTGVNVNTNGQSGQGG